MTFLSQADNRVDVEYKNLKLTSFNTKMKTLELSRNVLSCLWKQIWIRGYVEICGYSLQYSVKIKLYMSHFLALK